MQAVGGAIMAQSVPGFALAVRLKKGMNACVHLSRLEGGTQVWQELWTGAKMPGLPGSGGSRHTLLAAASAAGTAAVAARRAASQLSERACT